MYYPFVDDDNTEHGSFEVVQVSALEANYNRENTDHSDSYTIFDPGFYWIACWPGCLPDGDDFTGPFKTEIDAVADARGDV